MVLSLKNKNCTGRILGNTLPRAIFYLFSSSSFLTAGCMRLDTVRTLFVIPAGVTGQFQEFGRQEEVLHVGIQVDRLRRVVGIFRNSRKYHRPETVARRVTTPPSTCLPRICLLYRVHSKSSNAVQSSRKLTLCAVLATIRGYAPFFFSVQDRGFSPERTYRTRFSSMRMPRGQCRTRRRE